MKNVQVYYNGEIPQHLAVAIELPKGVKADVTHRSVCGGETAGMGIVEVSPLNLNIQCPDCQEQLKMWREAMQS